MLRPLIVRVRCEDLELPPILDTNGLVTHGPERNVNLDTIDAVGNQECLLYIHVSQSIPRYLGLTAGLAELARSLDGHGDVPCAGVDHIALDGMFRDPGEL